MLKVKEKRPILLTGAHRSGSTFTGEMLTLSSSIGYIPEPFNVGYGLEGIDNWFPFVKEGMEDEEKWASLIEDVLNGKAKYRVPPDYLRGQESFVKRTGRFLIKSKFNMQYKKATFNPFINRYLIKDPIACLASEWMHNRFNMDVVIIIRHPAAFVGSLKRVNWRFDFNEFIRQEHLMADHLDGLLLDNHKELSVIEEGSIIWNCLYLVMFKYLDRNPRMIGIRHEDLSTNPIKEFKRLYDKLNISFSKEIEEKIKEYTGDGNPVVPTNNEIHVLKRNSKENAKMWKQFLSEDEIKTIKDITYPLASRYYDESDW